ncbi:GNAT family N-acetyltransferase [Shouchella sp. 1P09AA]|uniref:GNAT family N-acetyltransferase n=1 Tax=unclassified Shouchella TaxID=2893065 RepID=UPI0039A2C896
MEFKPLATSRLDLIRITESYTEDFFAIMSREEVTTYYGLEALTSVNDAKKIVQSFEKTRQIGKGMRWGIIVKESNTFIGTIGLNQLNMAHKRAEVGFELHPDYWRKRYMTEALHAIIDYSFRDLDLHRLGAVTFLENKASIQLLVSLGFQKEGILRDYLFQRKQSHDANVFSLIQKEWAHK